MPTFRSAFLWLFELLCLPPTLQVLVLLFDYGFLPASSNSPPGLPFLLKSAWMSGGLPADHLQLLPDITYQ